MITISLIETSTLFITLMHLEFKCEKVRRSKTQKHRLSLSFSVLNKIKILKRVFVCSDCTAIFAKIVFSLRALTMCLSVKWPIVPQDATTPNFFKFYNLYVMAFKWNFIYSRTYSERYHKTQKTSDWEPACMTTSLLVA